MSSSAMFLLHLYLLVYTTVLVKCVSDDIIQRKISFIKSDTLALKDNWIKKLKLWNEFNGYKNCLTVLNESTEDGIGRRYIATKYYVNILEKLQKIVEIEKRTYSRIISNILEMFPQEILVFNRLNRHVRYHAEEMKTALSDLLRPLSSLSDFGFYSEENPINCSDIVRSEEWTWSLTSRVESQPSFGRCDIADFVLLPNGTIVNIGDNFVELCTTTGRSIKRFSSNVIPDYQDEISYWRDNKVLLLSIRGKTGNIYEIDLEAETVKIINSVYPYSSSYGISVIGDIIVTCSYKGILFALSSDSRVERYRQVTLYGHYYNVYVYRSEYGSDYGLFTDELFHNRYTLIKSTGERMCSVYFPQYSVNIAKAVVSKNGMFVVAFVNIPGFQAFDKYCNPMGEVVSLDPEYYFRDLNIANDELVISARSRDTSMFALFTYTFSGNQEKHH